MSRTTDTSTTGVVGLLNTATPASGAVVSNAQQAINETFDAVGMTGVNDATRKNYSSNQVVANGDSHKVAIGKLDAKFNSSIFVGHTHNGNPGEGPQISASNLANINLYHQVWQNITLTGASGIDDNISALMTGKSAGGGSSALGVLTTAGQNKAELFSNLTNTYLEDANGQRIFGTITEAAGVWTISYFTNEAGVETSHSLSTQDIRIFFKEIFSQNTRPTLFESPAEFGTLDITSDVVDASSTQRGVVSTGTQTFAGDKTLTGFLKLESNLNLDSEVNSAATGSSVTLALPSKTILKVSNASLVSIGGITAPATNVTFILRNVTNHDIDIINSDSGSTSIITGTGSDFTLKDKASCLMFYDLAAARWSMIGGGGGGANRLFQESPTGLINGTNDTFTLSFSPVDSDAICVFKNGVQVVSADYIISGANIIFSTPPAADSTLRVIYIDSGVGGGGGGGGGSGTFQVEYRTLTSGEAVSESLVLSNTPNVANKVILDIIGGGAQAYGSDYTVSTSTLSWASLGLSGLLASGDKLRIQYFT